MPILNLPDTGVAGFRKGILVTALLLMSVAASAADTKADPGADWPSKAAVLDLERAIMNTDVAREKIKALQSQKDFADMQKKIEGLQKDMERKQAEAKKEGPTWSTDQQANYLKEMEFMQKDRELAIQKIQGQKQDLEQSIAKDMGQKIKDAVDQIITEQKITLLLRGDAAYFAGPSADISDLVTDRLNKSK